MQCIFKLAYIARPIVRKEALKSLLEQSKRDKEQTSGQLHHQRQSKGYSTSASKVNEKKSASNRNVLSRIVLLSDDADLQEGRLRIQESIDLYREWGAHGKANALEEKYSSILSDEGNGGETVGTS